MEETFQILLIFLELQKYHIFQILHHLSSYTGTVKATTNLQRVIFRIAIENTAYKYDLILLIFLELQKYHIFQILHHLVNAIY
jgi:hypothetical protein